MSRRSKSIIGALLLLGLALRAPGLFENSFHPDEALYSSWARDSHSGRDRFLLDESVDKPPLLFFVQALTFSLLEPSPWAAKMPNLVASIITIALVATLAWRIYRQEIVVLISATLVTFSPLVIKFSASAFTDPLLTLFLLLAFFSVSPEGGGYQGSKDRTLPGTGLLAGLFFGFSIATKHQAWLFLPLMAGLAFVAGWKRRDWLRFLFAAGPVLLMVLAWDLAGDGYIDLYGTQLSSFGGLRTSWSWELWARFDSWGAVWGSIFDSQLLSFVLLLAVPPFVALLIHDQDRETAVDQILMLFILYYFILHWFVAIPAWERYVLPIVPALALLLGRFAWRVIAFAGDIVAPYLDIRAEVIQFQWIIPVLLSATVLPGAVDAAYGRPEVEKEADYGVTLVAETLSDAGYGTVLYDHWYSWQWRYHLYDSRVYVSWFAHANGLVNDLTVFGHDQSPRYLVLPDAPKADPVVRAVADAGFRLVPVDIVGGEGRSPGVRLFQIEPS